MENKKVLTQQVGTSWANILSDIGYIYNIPEIDYDTIKEMLKDETVHAALRFHVLNILSYLGEYAHEDEKIEELVKENFENLDVSFQTVLEDLLFTAKAYGFAVGELVWEVRNSRWMLAKIVPIPPETVSFKFKKGKISSVKQSVLGKEIELPPEKVFVLKVGSGPFGQSVLRHVYRPWKFKTVLFKFWAIAMERFAAPVLVGKTSDPGGVEALKEALEELWSNGVIAATQDIDVSILDPGRGNFSDSFQDAIEYANVLIYRALLLPQLLASTRKVGSYALGEVHLKLFMATLKSEARRLANEVIDQIITRIVEYNVGTVENYGEFLEQEMPTTEERAKLAQTIMYLVQAGVIDPVQDNEWIRELLRFPLPRQEDEGDEGDEELWEALQQLQKPSQEQKEE
mgnify:CR=1 FL=1